MNKVKSKYLKKCKGMLALLCAVYLASAGLVPAFTMESTEEKDKTTIQWENQSDVESLEGASEIESEDYVEFDWSDKAYDDSNASVAGDIQENETDESGSVADAKSLQLAIAAAMTGVIGVTAMNNVKKGEEEEVGTGVEGGLWTPENYRDQVLVLINKISKTQYTFSESGYLIRDVNKEDVEGKSASYSKLIDKIIGAGNTVVIGIGDTYNTIEGQMAFEETSESQGVSIGDNLTDQVVIISGQSGHLEDVKGKAIYDGPELALAHELAHAARGVYGLRSTDLSEDEIEMDEEAAAISFENIVRHELGYGLRGDGSTESDANGDGISDGDGSYGEFVEDSDDWFEEIEVIEGAMLSGGFFNFRSKSKKRRDKEKRDKKRRDKKRDKRERERKRESKKRLDKVKKSIKEKNDRTRKERDKKKRDKDRKSSSSSKKSNSSSSYDTGKKLYDKAKTDYANAKTDKAKAEAKARMDGLEKHLGIKNDKKTSTSSSTKNDKKSSGSSSKSHTSSKTSEVDKRAAQLVKAVENWDKSDASFKASVLEYNREINKYKNAKTDKERNDALNAMNGMNKRMDVNEKRKREHAEKEKIKNVGRQVYKIVPVNAAPPSAQETLSKEMLGLMDNPNVRAIMQCITGLTDIESLKLVVYAILRHHSDSGKAMKAAEQMGARYKAAYEAYKKSIETGGPATVTQTSGGAITVDVSKVTSGGAITINGDGSKEFNIVLDVVDYKQGDPRWASDMIHFKGTQWPMSNSGCAITSSAMLLDIEPGDVLKQMKKNGLAANIVWEKFAGHFGKTLESKYLMSRIDNFENLKFDIYNNIVNKGDVFIIKLTRNKKSNNDERLHYIVVKGIKGTLPLAQNGEVDYSALTTDMILVNDPGKSEFTLTDSLKDSSTYKNARISSYINFN